MNRLLNETQGSLLDNVELVDTLEISKKTSKEVNESVQIAEQNEIKIDAAREVRLERLGILLKTVNFLKLFLFNYYLKGISTVRTKSSNFILCA